MAGAIAGTTILRLSSGAERLRVVAATVNNRCNLRCAHCYLQYDGAAGTMSGELADLLVRSAYDHLAIVGKEPLVDRDAARLSASLIMGAADAGKSTSVITNGFGLPLLHDDAIRRLAYSDVSFDGGPETYGRYRRGSYGKLARAVSDAVDRGLREVNALHVLNSATLPAVDDMMRVTEIVQFTHIMFSPYIVTRNAGGNTVRRSPLRQVIAALAESSRFRASSNAFLLLDSIHLEADGSSGEELIEFARDLDIADHIRVIQRDPLEFGIMRVTYDGWALTPHDSIHPSDYVRVGLRVNPTGDSGTLALAFEEIARGWPKAA
jgi:hypothetical protein